MHLHNSDCGCLDCGFRRTASAEIARQSRLGVSEAVPEAKNQASADSESVVTTPETVTQLQQAVIEHDADMARLDRNTLSPPETIRISLPRLSDAEVDRLRQIQKEVAERPSDENAMQSACGEYNCPCHYQIGFLLERLSMAENQYAEGDRVRLLVDIWDDGADHHPPGYLAHKGEVLIVRKHDPGHVFPYCISHEEITDNSFRVAACEIERAN